MKRYFINIIIFLLAVSVVEAKPKQQTKDLWPDGTPISEWFTDTRVPELSELGKQYNLREMGLPSSPYMVQTDAIQHVIDVAAENGGGVVVVPEGIYKSGALHFPQGVHLHLLKGAVLMGSEEILDFPLEMTRMEGETCPYFPALINVQDVDGFTLTGQGTVDGNGSVYWQHFRLRRKWNPKCTNKDEQRPRLFYAAGCKRLLISGVTLQNSPFWTSHFYQCDSVRIQGVRYFSPKYPIASASTDGIDLDVCRNVVVRDCQITVNDDAVCLKGGKGPDVLEVGGNGPCENVLVENTTWNSSITCGSECVGAHNLLVRHCEAQPTATLLRLKMRPDTPQNYEYIRLEDIHGTCRQVVAVDSWRQFFNMKGRDGVIRSAAANITLKDINVKAKNGINIVRHDDEYSVEEIKQENVNITILEKLKWPEVTQTAKPWSRWWWLGGAYGEEDVDAALKQYAEVGLGGLEVTNIYGVKGEEKRFRRFLEKDWVDLFCYALDKAKSLNLGIDLANASGWPFGGPWIYGDLVCKTKVPRIWKVEGGTTFTDSIVCHQQPMVRGYNVPDIKDVKFPLYQNDEHGNTVQMQQWGIEQIRAPKSLPLIIITATNVQTGEVVDLTKMVDDGMLTWNAPQGDWTLCALFEGDHGKMVERAGPGGEGDTIDHFSAEACLAFLHKFDEAFKGRDISQLRLYFNDSYEVDDAQGMSDWTARMFQEFRERRGYDLSKHLLALLGEDTPEMNNRVAYDFRLTIDDLLLEKYTQTWHDWAVKRGKGIRNQAHGSPSNILDLYAVADIPEIEGRDLISIKAAPSAAHLTGKQLISSESATWLNEHFMGTLGDVKQALDLFFLGGVNHVFYHGTCFSPVRAEWPGWLFYAAAHFEPTNPWWGDFKHLNEYVTRTQSWMQQGRADNDLLVYYNITDLQATYDPRRPLRHFAGLDREMQQSHTRKCIAELDARGYMWDMISDRQLVQLSQQGAKGAKAQKLQTQARAILVPWSEQIPYETIKALVALSQQGYDVIFEQQLPTDVAGLRDYEARNKEVQSLLAKANVRVCDDVNELQVESCRIEASLYGNQLLANRRILDDGSAIYFIANRSGKLFEGEVSFRTTHDYAQCAIYNPMDGRIGSGNTLGGLHLRLEDGESIIVRLYDGDEYADAQYAFYAPQAGNAQEVKSPWTLTFVEGGPTLPAKRELTKLGSWTEYDDPACKVFAGTAEYTTTIASVNANGAPAICLSLGKVANNASVYLNDEYVGTVLSAPYRVYIPTRKFRGNDKLTIRVAGSMLNRIKYLDQRGVVWQKFYNINMSPRRPENRVNGIFNAANAPIQPCGLMGPVTLAPVQ